MREMTLSNAKASVTRLSNTFHIFHRAHPSRRASLARSLARATVLSRRVKIEANISSRLFFRRGGGGGGARSRGRTHVARQKTRFDAPFATLAEAAVKYRPACRSTRTFTLNLRATANVQGYQTRERRSSSAKVENRHGSLGNKMRAPALPWGWGPLDNPYCTPHPLVLPPYVRPSRRRPWPYILRSAGRVLSGLVALERNPIESICRRAGWPKFLKNDGRTVGNFCKFLI